MSERPTLQNPDDMAHRYFEGEQLPFVEETVDLAFTSRGRDVESTAKLRTFEDGSVYLESDADGMFTTRAEAIEYATRAAQMTHETAQEYGL